MNSKRFLMGSSAALAALALTSTAHAQAQPATQAASANTVEELVVTAEKRSQSLQDVPVAVTAFTSEKRDLMGIENIQDMTNFTPGLQYSSQLDRASLRGLGRQTNEHTAQGAVAIYSDGIYTSSTVEAGKPPIFTDRVEVLRGPQGTLYGRNAIGGAINVISARPTDDFYAEVRANLENYDHTILSGAVSGPTSIEGIDFRLVASWDKQTEGWIKNIVPGMPDEGNVIDTKIVEGQLKIKFNDNFDGWMKLSEYWWNNGAGGPGSRATWTPAPYPTYEFANNALALNPGYGCATGTLVSNVVNASPMGCVNPALKNPREIASTVPYQVQLGATVNFASEWTYHFSGMDLKYVFGGTHYHYTLTGPNPVDQTAPITQFQLPFFSAAGVSRGAVVDPRQSFNYQEDENWISHELNLASTDKGPLQWLVGAYVYNEGFTQPTSTFLPDQPGMTGPYFLPSTFCFQTGGHCAANSGSYLYSDLPQFEIQSRAVYGQADYNITPEFKATLGLRYSYDHEHGSETVRVNCVDVAVCTGGFGPEVLGNYLVDLTQLPSVVSGYPAAFGNPTLAGTPGVATGVSSFTTVDPATGFATRHYDEHWSATTGTAGVQWEPDRDTNVYLRYSRGYKAGGFRVGIDTTLGPNPSTRPEHVNAYELGIKKSFGRTVSANVSIFHYDYENAQVPITIVPTSGALGQAQNIFYNVPKAVTQGIEFETTWQPITPLQILLDYSYLDAHITHATGVVDPADPAALAPGAKPLVTLAQCAAAAGTPNACPADVFSLAQGAGFQRGQDLSGNHLPNAPKNKIALNVNYDIVTGFGDFIPSVNYIWRDAQYGSIFDRSYYRSPSFSQVDARVTFKPNGGKYTVILYGRNIFNTLGYEGGAGATRRVGFSPAYTQGLAPGGNPLALVPVNQGVVSTYPLTAPRIYGVELQYRF